MSGPCPPGPHPSCPGCQGLVRGAREPGAAGSGEGAMEGPGRKAGAGVVGVREGEAPAPLASRFGRARGRGLSGSLGCPRRPPIPASRVRSAR